ESLQHSPHAMGNQRDNTQRVPELGAARERGRPVAGVHVADGDDIPRAKESREPARGGCTSDRDRPVHIRQSSFTALSPPAGFIATRLVNPFQHSPLRPIRRLSRTHTIAVANQSPLGNSFDAVSSGCCNPRTVWFSAP